jgi:hypothetical protein
MTTTRLAATAALAAAAMLAVGAGAAGAATAPNFGTVSYAGDAWLNYDLHTQGTSDVDWPVDLIFWGNASISKVYSKLGWFWPGSNEYLQLNDGIGPFWAVSAGRKNTLCTDTHFRLYADGDGYLSNGVLGNYVVGTSHLDVNECSSNASFGWNETSEGNVAARARAVWGSAAVQANATFLPDGTSTAGLLHNDNTSTQGTHYFNNNGLPTLVKVP